jgi:branched-chain amino acid transport system permease protein
MSWLLGEYPLTLLTYVGLSAIVTLGLVMLTGHAGLPSFAQAGFCGVGAYTAAILTLRFGFSPWLTLPLSVGVTALLAWGGALIVVRLSGHDLSLATIALAVAVYTLFGGLEITGGQNGLSGLPPLSVFGTSFTGAAPSFLLVWVMLLLFVVLLDNLLNSRMGRAIRALKDEAVMAEAMGIDTGAGKTSVFIIACVMAGLVGWFYVYFQRFLNPSPFSLPQGIEYLFMAVIGGANMLWGAVAGAGLMTLLKPVLQLRALGLSGNFVNLIFGLLVIFVFQFAPEGFMPRLRVLWSASAPPRHVRPISGTRPSRRSPTRPLLEVTGARKAFGGVLANAGVDLRVHGGEIVALIGPNGAGKSTLFDLISGVTRPDAGTFTINGQVMTGYAPRAIARCGISRSFQHVRLVGDMKVIENVAIGAHARGSAGMISAMFQRNAAEEQTLLAEAAHQLSRLGLADCAWMAAGTLSLGQQRLIEIARALAADPLILLLDEPAAGLRHQEKQALAQFLATLRAEQMGVLLVEHDMDFVMTLADRVVVMENGVVISNGSPEQVQQDPRVRAAYLGDVV